MQTSSRSLTWSLRAVAVVLLLLGVLAHAGVIRADEEGDGEFPDEQGIYIDFQNESFDEIEVCYRVDPPAGDAIEDCTFDFFAFVPVEAPGSYTVTVTSVPSNCAVVSLNPVTVDVTADGPDGGFAQASFLLDCGTLADPTAGPVTVDAYVCEDTARAGEIDFLVGQSFVLASDLSCRLAGPGERSFRLTPLGDRPEQEMATDDTGQALFAEVPFGEFVVTDVASGIASQAFLFQPPFDPDSEISEAFIVTAIIYVAAVPTPTPSTGDEPGTIEVVNQFCYDDERAGSYDVFVGAAVAAEVQPTCFAEPDSFTLSSPALAEPRFVSSSDGPAVTVSDLPPGTYTVTLSSFGLISPEFDLPSGGYVRVTFANYIANESTGFLVRKIFCADPDRAGDVDFLVTRLVSGGEEVVESAGATDDPSAPPCRLARNGEITFELTRTSDGETWRQQTSAGAGSALFQALSPGEYQLTEIETGAVSDPFELPHEAPTLVVNWTDEVDQTPPTPTQDITILGLESLYCVDPGRAGDEEVFIGSGSYGTGPAAQSVETSSCVPDVGATFTVIPAQDDPFDVFSSLCGCSDIEVDPGSFEVVHEASGTRSPSFDVPAGGPTIVTFIHWVTEAPERAVVTINAVECTFDPEDPFDVCDADVLPGIDFTVAGQTRATDEDGFVLFATSPGEVTIVEDPADSAGYDGIYVDCFTFSGEDIPIPDEDDGTLFSGRADDGKVTIELKAFTETSCSWLHLIEEGGATKTPTPTPTKSSGSANDVTTLPNTGAPTGSSGTWPIALWTVIPTLLAVALGIRRVRRDPAAHRRR